MRTSANAPPVAAAVAHIVTALPIQVILEAVMLKEREKTRAATAIDMNPYDSAVAAIVAATAESQLANTHQAAGLFSRKAKLLIAWGIIPLVKFYAAKTHQHLCNIFRRLAGLYRLRQAD
jgi:hypothetical protein